MNLLLQVIAWSIPLIIVSWVLPKKYVLLSQILITAIFILYQSPISLFLLTFISFGNFYILHKSKWSNSIKITLSLSLLILLISVAKILFSIDENWVMPLGLSYYAFRNIHYTLEYYKGKIQNENILFYLAYNFFLPVFIIGPIHRYQDFIKDWHRRRFNAEFFSMGFEHIVYGIAKIVILGNYLLTSRGKLFVDDLPEKYIWLKAYLETLRFALNAYFQFAGFSDVAIGISLLLGFRIIENFNYPFLATNMQAFWTRYHISLSTFCKDYIYTPITSFYRKPMLGMLFTMLIIGLWHEVSLRYLIWGVIQMLGIYLSSVIQLKSDSILLKNLCRLAVLSFFALSCVVISQPTLADAWAVYKILFFIN